jgi:hypothetical protein
MEGIKKKKIKKKKIKESDKKKKEKINLLVLFLINNFCFEYKKKV